MSVSDDGTRGQKRRRKRKPRSKWPMYRRLNLVRCSGLRGVDKAVLLWLAFRANGNTGVTWPSIAQLVADCGFRKASVCEALNRLERDRWITRTRRYLEDKSKVRSTLYRVNFERLDHCPPDGQDCPPHGQGDCPPHGQHCPPDGHEWERNRKSSLESVSEHKKRERQSLCVRAPQKENAPALAKVWQQLHGVCAIGSAQAEPLPLTKARRHALQRALSEYPADKMVAAWHWLNVGRDGRLWDIRRHWRGIDTFLSAQRYAGYVEMAMESREWATLYARIHGTPSSNGHTPGN